MSESKLDKKIVVIESPFAGDIETNRLYLKLAMRDSFLNHDEIPIASHEFYTRILDDDIPKERELGIQSGFVLNSFASKTVVYQDLGISSGMKQGLKNADENGRKIEYRNIDHKILEKNNIKPKES